LWGTDYNASLIEWCRENLDFARFTVNALEPPLDYAEATFDFVYALSVFTHLPEELQLPWINELARVLRPGGYLLITTHGEHYLDHLSLAEQEGFLNGELVIQNRELAGSNVCGAFHPERYVRNSLAKNLSVVDFLPEGAKGNPFQDVYLLRVPV
jgi:SAM-dependent methyltransferase